MTLAFGYRMTSDVLAKQGSTASDRRIRLAIVCWIETTYHRRRHPELGSLAAFEFEVIARRVVALAA